MDADVFLLTDTTPSLLPGPKKGFSLTYNQTASKSLLDDLRSDAGMGWVPKSAWLTKLSIDTVASDLRFDLAVDVSAKHAPSPVAAGLVAPAGVTSAVMAGDDGLPWYVVALGVLALVAAAFTVLRLWAGADKASS